MTDLLKPRDPSRTLEIAVQALLALGALYVLGSIYEFAQTRFLTIDEFQWGHATWLVANGEVPYRDFYEHHLPLGYTLHAPLYDPTASFANNTLRFREVAFAYVLGALACLAWASWRTHRSGPEVWLTLAIVPATGFGLMSSIEYRGDNWSAFTLIACLALIEAGQKTRSRSLAAVAGVLFVLAIGMTQKILVLGGGAVLLMWIGGLWATRPALRSRIGAFRIERPWAFAAGAALLGFVMLVTGLNLGLLELAWQINVEQSLQHEALYPSFPSAPYWRPYLEETWLSSGALLVAAAAYVLTGGRKNFWTLPLILSAIGLFFIRAPFPYNFVLLTWAIGIAAVRAWCTAVRWIMNRAKTSGRPWNGTALLYGLPLLLLPAQLGFVSGTSSLDEQLQLLKQVERYSAPDDVVIDSAGSALFRPHRGYYWYHGRAHVQMFAPWFDEVLIEEMRESQAPLWIRTVRFDLLPEAAARYLLTHYIPVYGDLHALGFQTRATGPEERRSGSIEIVRPGTYYVMPGTESPHEAAETGMNRPVIDGKVVTSPTLELEAGWHPVVIPPNSNSLRFSYLPPEAFEDTGPNQPHTRLFEYRRSRRPSERNSP